MSSYLFTRASACVVEFFFFTLKLLVQKHTRNIREAEREGDGTRAAGAPPVTCGPSVQ